MNVPFYTREKRVKVIKNTALLISLLHKNQSIKTESQKIQNKSGT